MSALLKNNLTLLFTIAYLSLFAQMPIGTDTLYGNEWINYDQQYFKIRLANDGIHQISYDELADAGVFDGNTAGKQLQLFYKGAAIPTHVGEQGENYLTFYGQKNDGELDQHLYMQPDYQINTNYSLFTDTSAYFITWTTDEPLRFEAPILDWNNLPEKQESCQTTIRLDYTRQYTIGNSYGRSLFDGLSQYDLGEGYLDSRANTKSINFNTPDTKTEVAASITVRTLSTWGNHRLDLSLNDNYLISDEYTGIQIRANTFDLPSQELRNRNNLLIKALHDENDRFHLSSIEVNYTRGFDLQQERQFEFELEASTAQVYFEVSNFRHDGVAPMIYDLTNNLRLLTRLENNIVKVLLPPSAESRRLLLVNEASYYRISDMKQCDFERYDFESQDYDYLILTHHWLFDDGNGNNYVQEYADYRATAIGGGYKPLIVDVTQLYDQFGYGIYRHEQSIRNFMDLAHKHWESTHLFILGKGADKRITRNPNSFADWWQYALVPSFGYPHSDYLFAMEHNQFVPRMAVGRIAAYTPDHVRLYLKKVKEADLARYETPQTIADKSWMKRAIHFAGGDENIQRSIQFSMDGYASAIENNTFGGKVISFYKNSTDVVQNAATDQAEVAINDGSSLITFFGHSAPNTLDFDVGPPESYDTKGKYPIFYAIGCNSNTVLNNVSTISEQYVLIEDKGVIGYLGTMATTELSDLGRYATAFYENLTNTMYGATIGEVIVATMDDFTIGSSFTANRVKEIMMFHGDPAIRLYPHDGADFLVNTTGTRVLPSIITPQLDSFEVSLSLMNLGKAIPDSLPIRIEQVLPNGKKILLGHYKLNSPRYEQTYTIKLPLKKAFALVGKNELIITVDDSNAIVELPQAAEANNQQAIPFFISDNDTKLISPDDFGIVSTPQFTLTASTTDAFAPQNEYTWEIDTTALFNSPVLQRAIVKSTGGVLEWQPDVNPKPDMVYYWRLKLNETDNDEENWKTRSFVYRPESKSGWNQSDYYQYLKNNPTDIRLDAVTQEFQFNDLLKQIRVITGSYTRLGQIEIGLFEDGFKEFTGWLCGSPHRVAEQFLIAVYDSTTLNPSMVPSTGGNGSPNCWAVPIPWHITFLNTPEERAKTIDVLENIEDGKYVVLFSTQRNQTNYADEWAADSTALGTNLFQVLEKNGAKKVRELEDKRSPYIFMYQKGNPDFEQVEIVADIPESIIEGETVLTGVAREGKFTSLPIGPAKSWGSIDWHITQQETGDTLHLSVIGLDQNGKDSLLIDSTMISILNIDTLDATVFPYLQLIWHSSDSLKHTTAQLDRWTVLYEALPDAALDPNEMEFVFHADTLQQGEEFLLSLPIKNVSTSDMDSLLVTYTLVSPANEVITFQDYLAPIAAAETLIWDVNLSTRDLLEGDYQLFLEINPNQAQPEQYEFNNFGLKRFYIQADRRNPILDVSFDGRRISNGEIVSPSPQIEVYLRDENPFLNLNDTTLLELYILNPEGERQRFYFAQSNVGFAYQTTANGQEALAVLNPNFTTSGTYQLQVEATDRTGNKSGINNYKVAFQVLLAEQVTNVYTYPNPSSGQVNFVFTIAGEEQPDRFTIEVTTVDGKLVDVIELNQKEEFRLGSNRIEYAWDGRDENGNALPSGVYYYKVKLRNVAGESYLFMRSGKFNEVPTNVHKIVIIR